MLEISREALHQIRQRAREGFPLEICGLLAGPSRCSIRSIFPVANEEASATSYRMNGREQQRAQQQIEELGLVWIGVYHSHPTSCAYPSPTDVACAFWEGTEELLFPDLVHLIFSLQPTPGAEARCFRYGGRRIPEDIIEVTLTVVSPNPPVDNS